LRSQILSVAKHRKIKSRPKLIMFAAYGGVFALIISVIAVGYQPPRPTATTAGAAVANAAVQAPVATPADSSKPSVDELVATDIAANLAEQTNMPVSTYVANMSVSLAAKSELNQTSDSAIVKPEIAQPMVGSGEITTYVAAKGDTVQTVAAKNGLSSDTVKWANNLIADTLSVGQKLSIPPVDGVIYTVKAGDTPERVAATYAASKTRIVSFNNLEISGMVPGSKIVIPGGSLPDNQRPGYQAPTSRPTSYSGGTGYRVNSGIGGATAGNKYAYGNCTWYAYERRVQMGRPVGSYWGNAKTWAYYAAQDGFSVNRTPMAGAVLVDTSGYFGHVAVVESVAANGDITISEMNNYAYGGFGIVDRRTITAGQASSYQYIH
jgi:surface antigen